jgi:hypothetical protein
MEDVSRKRIFVVTHKLSLELLKRINDLDYVVSIKAAPYSAGASSDF